MPSPFRHAFRTQPQTETIAGSDEEEDAVNPGERWVIGEAPRAAVDNSDLGGIDIQIHDGVEAGDAYACLAGVEPRNGNFILRKTKGGKKGRRGSTFAGEELCLDVFNNGACATVKLAKNHNLIYEIDGVTTMKTSLHDVIALLAAPGNLFSGEIGVLARAVPLLVSKELKEAVRGYKTFLKGQTRK